MSGHVSKQLLPRQEHDAFRGQFTVKDRALRGIGNIVTVTVIFTANIPSVNGP